MIFALGIVGWIGQVVIPPSIFSRFSNGLVIRPCAGTDYPSVESRLADAILVADGLIHPVPNSGTAQTHQPDVPFLKLHSFSPGGTVVNSLGRKPGGLRR